MAVTDAKSNSSASQTLIAIVRKRSEAVLSSLVVSLVGLVSQESTRLLVLNEGRWSRCCKHAKTDTLMGHWIMNELVEAAPIRRTHTGDNSPMLSRRFSRFFFFDPFIQHFYNPLIEINSSCLGRRESIVARRSNGANMMNILANCWGEQSIEGYRAYHKLVHVVVFHDTNLHISVLGVVVFRNGWRGSTCLNRSKCASRQGRRG